MMAVRPWPTAHIAVHGAPTQIRLIDVSFVATVQVGESPSLRGHVLFHAHLAVPIGVHARQRLGFPFGALLLAKCAQLVDRDEAVMRGIDLAGAGRLEGRYLGLCDLAVMVRIHFLKQHLAPAAMAVARAHGTVVGEAAGADQDSNAGHRDDQRKVFEIVPFEHDDVLLQWRPAARWPRRPIPAVKRSEELIPSDRRGATEGPAADVEWFDCPRIEPRYP